mgnify:CR=1 FL=1
MNFTDIFVKKPVLATVVSLVILVIGLRAALSLPVRHNGAVVGTLYVVRDMAEVRAQSESALISAGLAAVIALGLGAGRFSKTLAAGRPESF